MGGPSTVDEQWAHLRELQRLEEACILGLDTGTYHSLPDQC